MVHARNKPQFVAPMLCKEVAQLPAPGEWFYEVKHDGRRVMAVKDAGNVSLFSRDGKPLHCPAAREAIRKLPVKSAVIDCELVALTPEPGRSTRSDRSSSAGPAGAISLCASDLLHLNGRDLTSEAIERRKERLCTITLNSAVHFAPSLDCEPAALAEHVKDLSLEGIVAKRKGSAYEPGKCSGAWLTMRVNQHSRSTGSPARSK
jgi:bifunctional non-homologous end joining protein LigD